MSPYARLFLRGYVIVALTACNVALIAERHYMGAFVTGFGISVVWWKNAGAASRDCRGAALVYGFGAACGTLTGMWLAGLL